MKAWNHRWLAGLMAVAALFVLAWLGLAPGGPLARAQSLTQVDQFGGAALAVAAAEGTLYAGAGPRVLALDPGDPASPLLLARSQPLEGVVQRILPTADRLLVAAGPAGLYVLRRDTLAVTAHLPLTGFAEDLALAGDRLYLALSPMWEEETGTWAGQGVAVVNLAQPDAPAQTGLLTTPGWPFGLHVDAGRLYVADGEDGLRIYDVSQPDAPQEIGHWPAVGVSRDVTVAGGYAYVADFHQGLRVVDVSDAAAAQEVAALTWPGRVYGVGKALRLHRSGQRLYVALREDGLAVVDVSDPAYPQPLGRWGQGEDVRDVTMTPAGLALADRNRGVHLLDGSDPAALSRLGGYETLGWVSGAILTDGEGEAAAYVAAGGDVKSLTWSPETGFHLVGWMTTPGVAHDVALLPAGHATKLAVADGPVWNGHDWEPGGLRVLDADSGQELAFYPSRAQAVAVTVAGERVYLADDADGVHVYERAGDGLVESQWLDWPGHIRDLAFTSRGAWVALPGQGVVETAADLPPTFQARFRYDGVLRVQGLAVNGSQLLVTESLPHGDPLLWGRRFPSRIHVLDISRPGQVVSQGEAATPGEALDLTVSRGFIFLAAGDAGLLVYAPE